MPPLSGSQAIWSFDLSPVTQRIAKSGERDAAAVEQEFRRFAALCFNHPDESLSPSKVVDEFWHQAVLDTPLYRQWCAAVFGEFIDHIPDATGAGMHAQFQRTVELYTVTFGAPDPRLWAEPGNSMKGRSGLRLARNQA
ncbi:MAG: hypothetical protein V4510_01100 [bacterium]